MGKGPRISGEDFEPGAESVSEIEAAVSAIGPEETGLRDWWESYVRNQRLRLAFDLDLVSSRFPGDASVVEFGSVPPILTLALKRRGYAVRGVDIAPERFAGAIEAGGLAVAKVNIETEVLPFGDESFDGALFNEVFEHLRVNPIFTLSEVRRVLRRRGTLLMSTPNLLSFSGWRELVRHGRAPGDLYEEYGKLETLGHMGHVREYTAAEVCGFLTRTGFEVVEVVYRGALRPGTRWKRVVALGGQRLVPSLRPFFSVVARRPAD